MTTYHSYALFSPKVGPERTFVGRLNEGLTFVTPLAHTSGTPLESLYELLETDYKTLSHASTPVSMEHIKLLPPFSQRDVLAVGKNYVEHAKEFNASGYDASDKVDIPSHPVIFTKRSTSIIAHGDAILPHDGFTQTLDYEGEIGVIVSKAGFRISEEEAADYVWGYTIINDVTAREKQRDHKQFYIGKSGDTFCPMGPVAVPADCLPSELRLQTHVNGELRQEGSVLDLIFSVPKLISTLSEAQTLRPGDVIATGTPAGVGFGLDPPRFLKPGDVVEISVTGMGTLRNKVAGFREANSTEAKAKNASSMPAINIERTIGDKNLRLLPNGKKMFVQITGPPPGQDCHILLHGLGGSSTSFAPLLSSLNLSEHRACIAVDLEGHGLSPTLANSKITISSLAADLASLYTLLGLSRASLLGHGLGALVALHFARAHPDKVTSMQLFAPPPPVPTDLQRHALRDMAIAARQSCMSALAPLRATADLSTRSRREGHLSRTLVLAGYAAQDPEGFAKGCGALAEGVSTGPGEEGFGGLGFAKWPVLIVGGEEDWAAPPEHLRWLAGGNRRVECVVLKDVGHWAFFEDLPAVVEIWGRFHV